MKPFLCSSLVALCLSVMIWAKPVTTTAITADGGATPASSGGARPAATAGQCRPGKTAPEHLGWRWRPGTTVKVYYLKDNFDAAESKALSLAVKNWNEALREIDADVAFIVAGERAGVVNDHASVTVLRGVPRVKKRVGETTFYSLSNGTVRLTVTINPIVTALKALTSLMTHELGHSLGLGDCYRCRRGTTAMTAFKAANKGNDVYAPSVCDKLAVASGYAGATNTQEARASRKPRQENAR
ncbi:MAG: M57 family metalloprotease [Pyrinomonadaceae bacterium]